MPPVPVGWETEPDDPWEQFDRAAQFTPFTAAFNVTGQPAVSLPLHWTDDRPADRRPARRSAARRRAPPPSRLAARGRAALGRPETAALVKRTSGTVIPLRERPCGAEIYRRRGLDASQSRPTLILIDCPARACSISAALPLLIATDMFR